MYSLILFILCEVSICGAASSHIAMLYCYFGRILKWVMAAPSFTGFYSIFGFRACIIAFYI